MQRMLVACAEKANFCLPGDIVYQRDESLFRIGRSSIEVVCVPAGKTGAGWRVRKIFETPDFRAGGMVPRVSVIESGDFGMESAIAKIAILAAIELSLDAVIDSVAN